MSQSTDTQGMKVFRSSPTKEKSLTFIDYTSSFRILPVMDKRIVPFSIALETPAGWTGNVYEKLRPTVEFEAALRSGKSKDFLCDLFQDTVLKDLSPEATWNDLKNLSHQSAFVLLCHEREDSFCHRKIVAKWFRSNGFLIEEFFSNNF